MVICRSPPSTSILHGYPPSILHISSCSVSLITLTDTVMDISSHIYLYTDPIAA